MANDIAQSHLMSFRFWNGLTRLSADINKVKGGIYDPGLVTGESATAASSASAILTHFFQEIVPVFRPLSVRAAGFD